jgi:surface protein
MYSIDYGYNIKAKSLSSGGLSPAAFVTEWTIPALGSVADRTIILPSLDDSHSGFTMDYDVNWGDGSAIENVTAENKTHEFPSDASIKIYQVVITGQFGSLNMERETILTVNYPNNRSYLTKMVQWGTDNIWSSLYRMFYRCINMLYEPTDFPNLTNLVEKTDAREMFRDCQSITSLDISNWTNTSNFTVLQSSFQGMSTCASFNASGLDFSSVTNFQHGLREVGTAVAGGCAIDLSNITWGSLTSLSNTFYNTDALTLDLSGWDFTGNPDVDLYFVFYHLDFNTALDLSSWTNFSTWRCLYAFRNCDITSLNITGWDTSSVASYYGMFYQCYDMEQVIGLNELSSAAVTGTGIQAMFQDCKKISFTGAANNFSTAWGLGLGNCNNLNYIFTSNGTSLVSGGDPPNVGNWVLTANTGLTSAFYKSKFSSPPDIESWDTSALTGSQASFMYLADWGSSYTLDLSAWNFTNTVTNWNSSFRQIVNLTSIEFDSANCDFGGVTSLNNMFYNTDQLVTIRFTGATDFSANLDFTNFTYDSDALETLDMGTVQDFSAVTNWNNFTGYNASALISPMDFNFLTTTDIQATLLSTLLPVTQIQTGDYDNLLIALDTAGNSSGSLQGGNSVHTLGLVDSGTTDGATTAFKLIDSTQNFITTVTIGDVVVKYGGAGDVMEDMTTVTAIDSDTVLSLNADMLISGDDYAICDSAGAKAKEALVTKLWTVSDKTDYNP